MTARMPSIMTKSMQGGIVVVRIRVERKEKRPRETHGNYMTDDSRHRGLRTSPQTEPSRFYAMFWFPLCSVVVGVMAINTGAKPAGAGK